MNKNMNGWKEIPLSKAKIYYRESGMDRSNDYVEDGLRLDFFSQYGPVQQDELCVTLGHLWNTLNDQNKRGYGHT